MKLRGELGGGDNDLKSWKKNILKGSFENRAEVVYFDFRSNLKERECREQCYKTEEKYVRVGKFYSATWPLFGKWHVSTSN